MMSTPVKDNELSASIGAAITERVDITPPGYFRLTFEVDGKLFGFDGDARSRDADQWMDKLTQLAAAVRHHCGYELWLGESEIASTLPEPPRIILPH